MNYSLIKLTNKCQIWPVIVGVIILLVFFDKLNIQRNHGTSYRLQQSNSDFNITRAVMMEWNGHCGCIKTKNWVQTPREIGEKYFHSQLLEKRFLQLPQLFLKWLDLIIKVTRIIIIIIIMIIIIKIIISLNVMNINHN